MILTVDKPATPPKHINEIRGVYPFCGCEVDTPTGKVVRTCKDHTPNLDKCPKCGRFMKRQLDGSWDCESMRVY